MRRIVRRGVVVAALGTTLLLASAAQAADERLRQLLVEAGVTPYRTPKPVTDFSYADVRTGRPLGFKQAFTGKVVFLNTWATWCPPCVREMPSFQILYDKFKSRGFVVLGLGYRERGGAAAQKAFVETRGFTYPTVMAQNYDGLPEFYHGFWLPQTYVIDRHGRVVGHRRGEFDWSSAPVMVLVEFLLGHRASP